MASSLPREKLDRTNYASWSYKMHQYLLGHGYWSYVEGANDAAPEPTQRLPNVGAIGEQGFILLCIMCGRTTVELCSGCADAKGAWENLKKIFAASTIARKLQFRQELSNLRQRDLSVPDYTSKFGAFRTAVCTREKTPSFFDLQLILLVEENHAGASTSTHTDSRMLYTKGDRSRGHGG